MIQIARDDEVPKCIERLSEIHIDKKTFRCVMVRASNPVFQKIVDALHMVEQIVLDKEEGSLYHVALGIKLEGLPLDDINNEDRDILDRFVPRDGALLLYRKVSITEGKQISKDIRNETRESLKKSMERF